MDLIVTASKKRAEYGRVYEMAAEYLTKVNGRPTSPETIASTFRLSPGPMIMGRYLNVNDNSYDFSPKQQGPFVNISTENKLATSDLFFITGLGLRLSRCDWAAGDVYTNHGNYPKLTFNDPDYFSYTKTSSKAEFEQLNLIRNALLSVNVMSQDIINQMPCENLLLSPTAPNVTASAATTVIRSQSQSFGPSDELRGFYDFGFNFVVDGEADTLFKVLLPTGAKDNIDGNISTGSTASATRNILWVVASGFRLSPGSAGKSGGAC